MTIINLIFKLNIKILGRNYSVVLGILPPTSPYLYSDDLSATRILLIFYCRVSTKRLTPDGQAGSGEGRTHTQGMRQIMDQTAKYVKRMPYMRCPKNT